MQNIKNIQKFQKINIRYIIILFDPDDSIIKHLNSIRKFNRKVQQISIICKIQMN
jgi:hypothetical protein